MCIICFYFLYYKKKIGNDSKFLIFNISLFYILKQSYLSYCSDKKNRCSNIRSNQDVPMIACSSWNLLNQSKTTAHFYYDVIHLALCSDWWGYYCYWVAIYSLGNIYSNGKELSMVTSQITWTQISCLIFPFNWYYKYT